MKTKLIILMLFTITSITQAAIVDFDSNQLINTNTYQNDTVRLDYFAANSPGTHLELTDNGSMFNLYTYNTSTAEINGGLIGWEIEVHDSSTVTVSGGSIGDELEMSGNSTAYVTGGSIGGAIHVANNSTVYVTGGSIGGTLYTWDNGKIYLSGSNFSFEGQSLNYGDSLRDYETPGYDYISGTITGTLQDGSALNNSFLIPIATNADIIIVPEPMSIILFGLGSFFLRA